MRAPSAMPIYGPGGVLVRGVLLWGKVLEGWGAGGCFTLHFLEIGGPFLPYDGFELLCYFFHFFPVVLGGFLEEAGVEGNAACYCCSSFGAVLQANLSLLLARKIRREMSLEIASFYLVRRS